MARSRRRWKPSSMTAHEASSRFPTRKRATRSIGRWVAESPMRRSGRGPSAAAASSSSPGAASSVARADRREVPPERRGAHPARPFGSLRRLRGGGRACAASPGVEPSGSAPFAFRATAAPPTSAAVSPDAASVPVSVSVPFPARPPEYAPVSSARSASSRSRVRARCAPRLLPATAWISSTMTVRVPARALRPDSLVSRM